MYTVAAVFGWIAVGTMLLILAASAAKWTKDRHGSGCGSTIAQIINVFILITLILLLLY